MFGDQPYRQDRDERTPTFVRVVKPIPLIELHDIAGTNAAHHVAPAFIARASDVAETKSTRAHTLVTLFDGKSIKVRESAKVIADRVSFAAFTAGA